MNVKQELKKISKEQRKTSRNVQFLINGGIIFTSLYKINEFDNKLVKILSLVTVGLAVFSQMVLLIEDIKEEWNAPDLVNVISNLGVNNAFAYKKELFRRKADLSECKVDIYKEYIHDSLEKKDTASTNSLIYAYMNSPMRLMVKIDVLVEEYLKFNDAVLDLVAELMQYEIEVDFEDDIMVFSSVLCDKYVFVGNMTTGEYRITDYDITSKAIVLKECL